MDDGLTTWDAVSLGVAILGLAVATAVAIRDFIARKRKLAVYADFGLAPLGRHADQTFFIVRAVNVRERPIGISGVTFSDEEGLKVELKSFQEIPELPATLADHEEARALYDPDVAAHWIAEIGMRAVYVRDADDDEWRGEIPAWVIHDARQIQESRPADDSADR
jgi:hypothetical protein